MKLVVENFSALSETLVETTVSSLVLGPWSKTGRLKPLRQHRKCEGARRPAVKAYLALPWYRAGWMVGGAMKAMRKKGGAATASWLSCRRRDDERPDVIAYVGAGDWSWCSRQSREQTLSTLLCAALLGRTGHAEGRLVDARP